MNDLISVIIPVYNREKLVEECLDSLTAQTYKNLEIILIDDGSTDNTLNICKKYANNDSRFKIIELSHNGVSAARNAGLDAAHGEYIFFIDSDDVIHPFLLETLHRSMKESNAEIAGSPLLNVGENKWYKVKEKIENDDNKAITSLINNSDAIYKIFHESTPINLIGGVMMSKNLISNTRFNTDIFIGEDFYFIYQNLIKGASVIYLGKKWYFCRMHKNNSSKNLSYSAFYTRFSRMKLVWESEIRFGRVENANIQKNFAYGCFKTCGKYNKPNSEDFKKMRNVLKVYRKEFFEAFDLKTKFLYLLYAYVPYSFHIINKIYNSLRIIKKKIKK